MNWLAALDPGASRFARGVHILLVIVLAVLGASWIETLAHAPESAVMALIAPIVGAHTLLFTVPGTRFAEALSVIKLTAVALAVFVVALLIGWGDLGFGDTPSQIAWVFVIGLGFYLRRYGPVGFRFGMMVTLMFMFVVVFNPTRTDAAWWLLAAMLGGLSGVLVSLLVWRPSALRAFFRQRDRFLAEVVERLKVQQKAVDTNTPAPHHGRVHKAWVNLARSSDLAVSIHPTEQARLELMVAAGLRMVLALEVVADDAGDQMENASPTSVLQQALTDTIDLLSVKSDPSAISDSLARMREIRNAIVAETDTPGRERFHQAWLIIGLLRIVLGFQELTSNNCPDQTSQSSDEPTETIGSDKSGARILGQRLALQAMVAAGITTVIGLIFGLEHPYWATLTVVIVIGASLGATVRRTLERGLGTAIGVAVAIATLWITGGNTTVLTILVVLALLPITVTIERYYIVAAGLIGFIVVTGLHLVEGLTTVEMLSRAYDTVIGAAVGLIVAWLLLPIRSADHVRKILRGFRNDCRSAIQDALAGKTQEGARAGRLQKDTGDLAAELSNIQSERLLGRSTVVGTRRLQAYADSLAIYVALLATLLERLSQSEVPAANRALLNELANGLSESLEAPLDEVPATVDVADLTKRWIDVTKLDGAIPQREAIWLIEVLVFGRKSLETLNALRELLVRYSPGAQRRHA